ncbi:glycine betaine ABC transporter substrate-binding protein [Blastococcus xanthinilyticus]|uniref:Osmoprotectant transport system substrate-binding protein n=1 Tax=Blastococcus xanthinilyticus TaxID=1564164 RepID=A0A5S5CNW1_9ACTN|nr:glycine betaine ABC transporter substrate-binding protein [Blastococcus xanthinilyticus]TYP83799.1 osmoprotectant transport system substrate-binding protein [Blastococcus xanthinilyticus]
MGSPRRSAAVLAAATLLMTGCGLQSASTFTPDAAAGEIEPIGSVEGAPITVGAKNFTEQLILGKIAVIALQVAGFDVTDRSGIPGAAPARAAMLEGETDMQWEYTGTGWINYLGMGEGIPDEDAQWAAVRDADAENGITWLPPAEANNTYAFAVRSEAVDELGGVATLSDIAALPVEERTFCLESEFATRVDGFEPMLEAYGIPLGDPQGVPRDNISILDTGAVYTATDEGESCNFGEVFTTDGRIASLDLTVLEDDLGYFPAYNISPIVLTETLEEYPEIADVFAEITPRLTDEVMIELNGRVDVGGEDPAEVALDWLVSEGLVTRG